MVRSVAGDIARRRRTSKSALARRAMRLDDDFDALERDALATLERSFVDDGLVLRAASPSEHVLTTVGVSQHVCVASICLTEPIPHPAYKPTGTTRC